MSSPRDRKEHIVYQSMVIKKKWCLRILPVRAIDTNVKCRKSGENYEMFRGVNFFTLKKRVYFGVQVRLL